MDGSDEAAAVLIESIVAAVSAGDDRRISQLLRLFSARADIEALYALRDALRGDLRERARLILAESCAAQVAGPEVVAFQAGRHGREQQLADRGGDRELEDAGERADDQK
ncbi:hypothetical protein ACIRVF_31785 [Kitasatospora sp. NPDC101157]|uniref:hypothetical protein n=1 Tax=Kitasatospora sp. NPDC101157 TaxID=3364098 RepID=UPI0037F5B7EC